VKDKQHYLVPVLAGGVLAAVLSAIPIVNYCNLIFCMWMLLGAGLAVKLVQDKTNTVDGKEGAMIGLLTGLVTGGLFAVLYLLMFLIFGAAMIPGAAAGEVEGALGGTVMMLVITVGSCFVALFAFGGFGALGGLLASMIFPPKNDDAGGGGGFAQAPSAPGFGQPPGGPGAPPAGGFGPPPGGPGAPPAGGFGQPPSGGGQPPGGGSPWGQ